MVNLGSGFDYLFAFAFALYLDFALEVDFFYALKVDFGFASRLVLVQTMLQIFFLVVV